jgi:hypothetical protein
MGRYVQKVKRFNDLPWLSEPIRRLTGGGSPGLAPLSSDFTKFAPQNRIAVALTLPRRENFPNSLA